MTEPAIKVTMGDGSEWIVQFDILLQLYAETYAHMATQYLPVGDVDYPARYAENFDERSASGRQFPYAVIGWASANLDWDSVVLFAKREQPPEPDYAQMWRSALKEYRP